MTGSRREHRITETPELSRALDAASQRWPHLDRTEALVQLALEAHRSTAPSTHAVVLVDAVAAVPFTVLVLDHLRGTALDVFLGEGPHVWLRYGAFTGEFVVCNVYEHAVANAPGPVPGEQEVTRDGRTYWAVDGGPHGEALVRTVMAGTDVLLQSRVLDVDALLRLAGTLRPAEGTG
ncbi:MAG: hypothetical protein U0Y82_13105 [Thermoleophilia bacterium]